ncbi:MAG: hypothetical protein K6G62_08435, partial [Eubacterium sp.]|nr:hypothetical protein [Eubacterium sp.]
EISYTENGITKKVYQKIYVYVEDEDDTDDTYIDDFEGTYEYEPQSADFPDDDDQTCNILLSSSSSTVTKPGPVNFKRAKIKAKRKLVVQWYKVSGAKGYQLQYSTKKSFKKKKTKSKFTKKTSFKTKKLKRKKKYFVRIRAYKMKNGKKLYGAWSAVLKVKIK